MLSKDKYPSTWEKKGKIKKQKVRKAKEELKVKKKSIRKKEQQHVEKKQGKEVLSENWPKTMKGKKSYSSPISR